MDDRTPPVAPEQPSIPPAPPPLSRRHFLQTASLLGAGMALAPRAVAALPSAPNAHRSHRLGAPDSDFAISVQDGAILSLKYARDSIDTEYVAPGGRLGDTLVRYRRAGTGALWRTARTATLADRRTVSRNADNTEYTVAYEIADGASPTLTLESRFTVQQHALRWTLTVRNRTRAPLEIGDLALPLPMTSAHRHARAATTSVLKHSFISGHGSFLFWMRSNSVGPYLTMTPLEQTSLEFWDAQDDFTIYIHSAAAGQVAREHGCRWRQPNTGLTLAPAGKAGDEHSYGLTLHWAKDYNAVRQLLVDQGLIDVHVVPGMTVPSDLFARIALHTTQPIQAVDAEFPHATTITPLGERAGMQLYEVRFSRLGENRLTVRFGSGRHVYLEFFATEPLETLIAKRAAFVASHQHRDPARWYNGLLAEWNMDDHVMLGPDNYDRIRGWRIYEVTCDDPGLSRPAFLAAKNAEFPVQREVEALDYYIEHFVWGGLQRTTQETYAYGIYGIPDWKTNRESRDPGRNGRRHLWRIYDYPHVMLMYFSMYRVATNHPQVRCALDAREYLQRAYGTAVAMFTVPYQIEHWSAYETGLYNELVIVPLMGALEAAGMEREASTLRKHWERKVDFFVNDKPDLFASEYSFDSTGFESTHAIARYAVEHAAVGHGASDNAAAASARDARDERAGTMPIISPEKAKHFMEVQMAANIFCRGWLEPAYYYLGSDYRSGGGNRYTLTYMSQMGGWSVLDYALHFAADRAPYLRLGYASYLSAWALVNSGTRHSNYGYWYPGAENDGGAGGGFEPAAYGMTWLEQPHHRGSWYYSCEINLGYCGALRSAATVLADDPIFGRFCFGGELRETAQGMEIVPRDGVRRRFHAMLHGGTLHLESEVDRFAASMPITLANDLSEVRFQLESDNAAAHLAALHLSGVAPGRYSVRGADGETAATVDVSGTAVAEFHVHMDAGAQRTTFVLMRELATNGA